MAEQLTQSNNVEFGVVKWKVINELMSVPDSIKYTYFVCFFTGFYY